MKQVKPEDINKLLELVDLYNDSDQQTVYQLCSAINQLNGMKDALADRYTIVEIGSKGQEITRSNPLLKPINDLHIVIIRLLKELKLTPNSRANDNGETSEEVKQALADFWQQ